MTETALLKTKLLALCAKYVDDRISAAQQAIQSAQASANEETKSSSGDKYETGRAMAQLEIEKNTTQLYEAQKLKQVLQQINTTSSSDVIQNGSIVKTNQENYFISIPAGKLLIDGESFYAISIASPISQKLVGLKCGASITFNKKEMRITDVL